VKPSPEENETRSLEGPADGPEPDTAPSGLEPLPPTPDQVQTLQLERDELRDRLLRKAAELENFKKKAGRDRQTARLDTAAGILAGLLPTLDNLDRALQAQKGDEAALREGIELTRRDLLAALEAEGLSCLDPSGQPFDPEIHQALVYEAVPGTEEGMIVEVFRKGYRLRERLLRPALVKVARRADDESPSEAQNESLH
jgi:molecular chaperone GrpE